MCLHSYSTTRTVLQIIYTFCPTKPKGKNDFICYKKKSVHIATNLYKGPDQGLDSYSLVEVWNQSWSLSKEQQQSHAAREEVRVMDGMMQHVTAAGLLTLTSSLQSQAITHRSHRTPLSVIM